MFCESIAIPLKLRNGCFSKGHFYRTLVLLKNIGTQIFALCKIAFGNDQMLLDGNIPVPFFRHIPENMNHVFGVGNSLVMRTGKESVSLSELLLISIGDRISSFISRAL